MSGKSLMHGQGESYHGIVPTKQPNQSGEPPAEVAEGRPWTKENTPQPNPLPDTEPGKWAKWAGGCAPGRTAGWGTTPSERALRRQAFTRSEVGTVCASSASTGLCGGQRVTAVPTATDSVDRCELMPKPQGFTLRQPASTHLTSHLQSSFQPRKSSVAPNMPLKPSQSYKLTPCVFNYIPGLIS